MKPNQTAKMPTPQPLQVTTSRGWVCLLCLSTLLLNHCTTMPSKTSSGALLNQPVFSVLHAEKPEIFPTPERLPHPDGDAAGGSQQALAAGDGRGIVAQRIRRNLNLFGRQNLTPSPMEEDSPAMVLQAITGVLVSDAEENAHREAQALIAQSVEAVMNLSFNPPAIHRISVALAPPPSNPQAGEEALHLLTQRARDTIEKTLGQPLVQVTISPQLWRPVPKRGAVRYRKKNAIESGLAACQAAAPCPAGRADGSGRKRETRGGHAGNFKRSPLRALGSWCRSLASAYPACTRHP